MQVTIRSIGNSKGVVLPKPLLAQVGLGEDEAAEMTVEDGAIVLRKAARPLRAGWAEAARALASNGGDELVMGEFGNDVDAELGWCGCVSRSRRRSRRSLVALSRATQNQRGRFGHRPSPISVTFG